MNSKLIKIAKQFIDISQDNNYSNTMTWMGIPSMQYPTDLMAIQDVLWSTKPDCVIATGVAQGGTLVFLNSIMKGYINNPLIIGIDPTLSFETKKNIQIHPMGKEIIILEYSSDDEVAYNKCIELTNNHKCKKIMVILDSRHETEYVMKELELWSRIVSIGCYIIIEWTIINESDSTIYKNKSWGKNSNPRKAVNLFLEMNTSFLPDDSLLKKYYILTSGHGFLIKQR